MTDVWSYGLAALSVYVTVLLGERKTSAWLVGVAQQFLWITYALVTTQYGFIISAVIFTVINARNYVKWRQLDREEARARAADSQRLDVGAV